ncbi:MAG: methionine adenosyltransferase domain-containing protein, partial [Firmicutes bacterium]|nr:methionine adenosyltransferase domain-containing protein [Candidatus Fermentithermobacillaceae bacterium]
ECEVQVAYVIGVARPVSLFVDTKGTGKIPDNRILEALTKSMDFRPAAIIDRMDLRKPVYEAVSAYGHFGRSDLDLPWERLDLKDELLKYV